MNIIKIVKTPSQLPLSNFLASRGVLSKAASRLTYRALVHGEAEPSFRTQSSQDAWVHVGTRSMGARDGGVGIGEKWDSQPGFGQAAGRP